MHIFLKILIVLFSFACLQALALAETKVEDLQLKVGLCVEDSALSSDHAKWSADYNKLVQRLSNGNAGENVNSVEPIEALKFLLATCEMSYQEQVLLPLRPDYSKHGQKYQYDSFIPIMKLGDKGKPNSDWLKAMKERLELATKAGVSDLYFVHGTFVGDDPFGLAEILMNAIDNEIIKISLKSKLKSVADYVNEDNGNFTSVHRDLINKAKEGLPLNVKLFTWSSGNHHIARLKAAIQLIKELTEGDKKRALLNGHSHAGQVFALVSQMIKHPYKAKLLLDVALDQEQERRELLERIRKLKSVKLDFVTYGTPPRYEWAVSENVKILHFINHRELGGQKGKASELTDVNRMLLTQGGDYVQHFGIEGSDTFAVTSDDQHANQHLNTLLDKGRDPLALLENVTKNKRVPVMGDTILVDYKDQATTMINLFNNPIGSMNAHRTVLGHGVYTHYDKMLFNFDRLTKMLYQR